MYCIKHCQEKHGPEAVWASDIRVSNDFEQFVQLDVTDYDAIRSIVIDHGVTQVYHLAAILSAKAEQNPKKAWDVNMTGLLNVLNCAVETNIDRLFYPSSIAVFGTFADKVATGQWAVQHPTTLYGISKSAGENWCQYYALHHDLDVRSLRYPGVIGYQALPGGGTTDYAVHIFHDALANALYTCYLSEDTALPMIYIDDVIEGTIRLMEVPKQNIQIRTSYNIQAMTFTPKELVNSIREFIPSFRVKYFPDQRQAIADSWPNSLNDEQARSDWQWNPKIDLSSMTRDMFKHLKPTE